MDKLISPFLNDPLPMVWTAFRRLYPEARVDEVFYDTEENMKDESGEEVYGYTNFADDGFVQIFISASLSIITATEILAHELAHAVVGKAAGHNEEWEKAFSAIHNEYGKVICERFTCDEAFGVEI